MEKVYFKSILITSISIIFGIFVTLYMYNAALGLLIIPSIGFGISWFIIQKNTMSIKSKIKLFLLNPIFYFWLFIVFILCIAIYDGYHHKFGVWSF